MKLFTAFFAIVILVIATSSACVTVTLAHDDLFSTFCTKNKALCDEINNKGMPSRHELVAELGTALYRSTFESVVEIFAPQVMKRLQDETSTASSKKKEQLPSIVKKYLKGIREQQQHSIHSLATAPHHWADDIEDSDLKELRQLLSSSSTIDPYPYFGFVPFFHTKTGQNTQVKIGETKCSSQTLISIGDFDTVNTKSVKITVATTMKQDRPLLCTDYWLFTAGPSKLDADVLETGTHSFVLNLTESVADPSLLFDLNTNGVRIFRNVKNKAERTLDTLDTLSLFKPMLTNKLDAESAQKNINFLNDYTKMKPFPTERSYKGILKGLDLKDSIKSGDMGAKMELDGLGPVEGLGQGTMSGHFITFLWNEPGTQLYACESIIKGVTCTPFEPWLENLQNIGMMIVLVPVDQKYLQNYNFTAAWKTVNQSLGNAYGYPNFLSGWIDTVSQNYPCFPSTYAPDNFKRCLTAESLELFLFHLNQILPGAVNYFIGQGLNHRAGTWNLGFTQVLEAAYKNTSGKTFGELMAIPENDNWLYNQTKRGDPGHHMLPSQVCSTLGCNIAKAGGIFDSIDNKFECTEMDVWDMFSLKIFDENRIGANRPAVCRNADPDNLLCQLCGNYTFNLIEDFNKRQMWAGMNNVCATQNPSPYNHSGCYQP